MNPKSCETGKPKKGFKYHDIASVVVEDNGELRTMNSCRDCYTLRQGERKEPVVNNRTLKLLVAEKRSRGKLASGPGTRGLEQKILEINAKNLLKEAVVAVSLGKEWRNKSPHKKALAWLQKKRNRHDGVGGRLVGAEDER